MSIEKRSSLREHDRYVKFMALALVLGLLGGMLGATLGVKMLALSGPAGPKGDKGDTGDTGAQGQTGAQGAQGPQGVPGVNGTDSVLQMVQRTNDTQISTSGYAAMQWFNLSIVDSSMQVVISVQQGSRVFVEFSGVQTLSPPASIWVRIVVDSVINSSRYICSTGPPASGTYTIPGHLEFLTDSLNAGLHTVNVQFSVETGSPLMLDRTLTVMEVSA